MRVYVLHIFSHKVVGEATKKRNTGQHGCQSQCQTPRTDVGQNKTSEKRCQEADGVSDFL